MAQPTPWQRTGHGEAREHRRRVLVLSTDPIGPTMPGPAIRAWHLAQVLGEHCEVVLASTVSAEGPHPNADLRPAVGPELPRLVGAAEVCFAPSALVYMCRELRETPAPLAVDIYDPYHLENLEMVRDGRPDQAEDHWAGHDRAVARQAGILNVALRRGDFFTCASERQRDFWLGSLAALGRVNPYNCGDDPLLDRLVAVVPFGLPSEPPRRQAPAMRGVLPGVGEGDKVVLWGGGVYDWLDPISVVRAVDLLRHRVPDVRLVFLGMGHPNPDVPPMPVAAAVEALAGDLGLTGRHVFFKRGWAPYERRADFLLEADVAVSAHLDHLETRYSFRSRVLDYLWAGLPMVLTGGDVLAEEVAAAGLGVTVPAGDVGALADGLQRMLARPPEPAAFGPVAERYRWERVAAPLVRFCRDPRRAPDLLVDRSSPDEAAALG
jgi:glycosyltransferase involved in cell wall biosynthesis